MSARALFWIFAFLALAAPAVAQESVPTDGAWVTNQPVKAMTYADGTVYLGGDFTHIGPNVGAGVPLAQSTGEARAGWPRIDGEILAAVDDGAGGWYVGGLFSNVGGLSRTNLVHVTAAGTVDPSFDPSPDGRVRALARVGDTLYVGGTFTSIGGESRSHLAALTTTGATPGAATGWNPSVSGGAGAVHALAVSGTTLFAGGSFSMVGMDARSNIAAIDRATGVATTWSPAFNGRVRAIAVDGTSVYAGGEFTQVGATPRARLASVSLANGSLSAWTPNPQGDVSTIALADGKVYAGGNFTFVGSAPAGTLQTRTNVASWTIGTDLATAWDPGPDSQVFDLTIVGTTVYLGGVFTHVGATERIRLAAVDAATGAATAWDPRSGGGPQVLEAAGGEIFAGGNVTSIGGIQRSRLAAVDALTGVPTAWNPAATGSVEALVFGNGLVYVGGNFGFVGGEFRSYIAALDPVTGAATGWNPSANSQVTSIAPTPSRIYITGDFTNVGGATRARLAALDATIGGTVGLNAEANGIVTDVEVRGSDVYVVGGFTFIGGKARNGIVELDDTATLATDFDPGLTGLPRELVRSGGRLVAIGEIDQVGVAARGGGVAFDLDAAGATMAFDPLASNDLGTAMADGDTVYTGIIGSNPITFGPGAVVRRGAAAVTLPGGALTNWDPRLDDSADAFVVAGDALYVGGQFDAVGGAARRHLARFPFPLPVAVTGGTSAVDTSSAAVSGSVNPQGRITAARIAWGTSTAYGSHTPLVPVGTGSAAVPVSAGLTGLAPGATYHYRVEAIRDGTTVKAAGADATFTTASPDQPSGETTATQTTTGPAPTTTDPAPTTTTGPAPTTTTGPAPTTPPGTSPGGLVVGTVPKTLSLARTGTGTLVVSVGAGVRGTYRLTAKIPVRRGSKRVRTASISKGSFSGGTTGRARLPVKLSASVRRRVAKGARLRATLILSSGGRTLRRTVELRIPRR